MDKNAFGLLSSESFDEMKKVVIGSIFVFWLAVFVGIMYPSLMYQIGTHLTIYEPFEQVEIVVASWVNDTVIDCYKEKRCKRILIVRKTVQENTWKSILRLKSKSNQKQLALKRGIIESDIEFFNFNPDRDGNRAEFIIRLLKDREIRSALILVRFFKTRRYRFYFDRLYRDYNIVQIFVQPVFKDYKKNLIRWWEKTTYANYFLSEYLRIGYYYFNKTLLYD